MFFLKKIFEFRGKINGISDKPVLEHLDDLRGMVLKSVIVLLVTTILSFTFAEELVAIMRYPVEKVWTGKLREKLPAETDIDVWRLAIEHEKAIGGLSAEQKKAYLAQLETMPENTPVLRELKVLGIYRAAKQLADPQQSAFLSTVLKSQPEISQNHVKTLLKQNPTLDTDARKTLQLMGALRPAEGFSLSMKLSFYAGIILALPFLFFFALQFILPGLHESEKSAVFPALLASFFLFLVGIFFAYFVVLPKTLRFFYDYNLGFGIENEWRIGEYMAFATQFVLIFGLAFELPVVVMTIVKLGFLHYDTMKKTRSYAMIAVAVAAAILTPTTDVPTMLLLALPMYALYEICILLACRHDRKKMVFIS